MMLGVFNIAIVSIAAPALIRDLNTSVSSVSWVLNSFNITQAVLLLSFGRLADRFGCRRIFLVSVTMFTVFSLACGFAQNVQQLIAFRIMQGVGSAGMVPISLVRTGRPRPKRARSSIRPPDCPNGWTARATVGTPLGLPESRFVLEFGKGSGFGYESHDRDPQRSTVALTGSDNTRSIRQDVAGERMAETPQKLIDAAVDLFLNVGYHAVRIEDITAYAGVGKGTFYLHFSSKRDLLLAYFQSVVQLVEGGVARFGGQDLDYFTRVARRMSLGIDPAGHWTNVDTFLRISANSMDEETAAAARQVHGLMVERGAAEFLDAMQHGEIRRIDPELAGLTLAGMTEVLSWHLAHGDAYDSGTVLAFMDVLHRRLLEPHAAAGACPQTVAILESVERVGDIVQAALPPSWPPQNNGDTRGKIIHAAVELFLHVGYQNLRVDEITSHAGIGKGTFYHHFSSKQDLLLAYFRHTVELVRTSEQLAAEAELDHLGRIAFRMRLWLERDTKWNRIVTFIRVMANSSNREIATAAWEAYDGIIEPARKDLDEAMRVGLVREMDPGLAALALVGMEEVLAWRLEQDDKYDSSAVLAFMADAYCYAFLK